MNGSGWLNDEMQGKGIAVYNSCGVYAYKRLEDACAAFEHHPFAIITIGSVKLWGTVIEHENGYRAEFAKIHKIHTNPIPDEERARVGEFLEQQKGLLPKFEAFHFEDKQNYSFRCEVYGNLLAAFITRGKFKTVVAIPYLEGMITLKDSASMDWGNWIGSVAFMETGTVGILSVGAGDIKLSFDRNNQVERIRAARIVKDMVRRGYALLIEVVDAQGNKTTRRALDFDENTCEYIIADFDPMQVSHEPYVSTYAEPQGEVSPAADKLVVNTTSEVAASARKPKRKRIPADTVRATAVAHSAGG